MKPLPSYIAQNGTTQRAIAKALDVSPSFFNELVQGKKTPGLKLAMKIETLTGGAVPVSSWFDAQSSVNDDAPAQAALHKKLGAA